MTYLDVQFATEHGFVSWAIRWRAWSRWSHVDLVLPSGDLLGARSDGGVQIRKPNYAKFSATQRYRVILTEQEQAAMLAFAHAQVGKPYDYTAIAGFLAHRDWTEDDSWFCSELGEAIFSAGGHPMLNPRVPVYRISPGLWEMSSGFLWLPA